MVMGQPLLVGFLESLGVDLTIGIWVVLVLSAFYIWRTLKIGSKVSSWLVILASTLVVIGIGLALGVIQGIDIERFFGLVQAVINFGWEFARRVMEAL